MERLVQVCTMQCSQTSTFWQQTKESEKYIMTFFRHILYFFLNHFFGDLMRMCVYGLLDVGYQ